MNKDRANRLLQDQLIAAPDCLQRREELSVFSGMAPDVREYGAKNQE